MVEALWLFLALTLLVEALWLFLALILLVEALWLFIEALWLFWYVYSTGILLILEFLSDDDLDLLELFIVLNSAIFFNWSWLILFVEDDDLEVLEVFVWFNCARFFNSFWLILFVEDDDSEVLEVFVWFNFARFSNFLFCLKLSVDDDDSEVLEVLWSSKPSFIKLSLPIILLILLELLLLNLSTKSLSFLIKNSRSLSRIFVVNLHLPSVLSKKHILFLPSILNSLQFCPK